MDDKLAAQLLEHNNVLPIVRPSTAGTAGTGLRATRRLHKLRDVLLRVCSLLRDPTPPQTTEGVISQRLYEVHATTVENLDATRPEYTSYPGVYLQYVATTVDSLLKTSVTALKMFTGVTSTQLDSIEIDVPFEPLWDSSYPDEEGDVVLFALIDATLDEFVEDIHDSMTALTA